MARSIAQNAVTNKIIVEKSTVPVGTAKNLKSILTLIALDKAKKNNTQPPHFEILSNPEFLAEGNFFIFFIFLFFIFYFLFFIFYFLFIFLFLFFSLTNIFFLYRSCNQRFTFTFSCDHRK